MWKSFSTEVVDLDHQAPNRNKRESKYFWDELYELLAAAGFDRLEIPYEVKWDFGGRSGIPRSLRSVTVKFGTVEAYREYLRERGIDGITGVHFDPTLFCSGTQAAYFGAAGHFGAESVDFAARIGAGYVCVSVTPPHYDVHQLFDKNGDDDAQEQSFLEETAAWLNALAERADRAGVRLCLKNEYWGLLPGERILGFLPKLSGSVMLDADTAHLKIANTDPAAFIRENGGRLGVVHFTDTAFEDTEGARFQPLPEFPQRAATKVFRDVGTGNVDWKAVKAALEDVKYGGQVVCNCRDSYDIYRSILRAKRFFMKEMGC